MKITKLLSLVFLAACPLIGQQPNYPYSTVQVPGATGGPPQAGGVNATQYEINGVPISVSGGPFLPLAGGTLTGTLNGTTANFNAGINATSDGVHAGADTFLGNTTAPALPANSFQIVAPLSASFTSFTLQTPTTAPGNVVNAIGTTATDGWFLQNTTLSTAGVPNQYAPSLHWQSHVWNTTATAADNQMDWTIYPVSISGAFPNSQLTFCTSLSTGTPSYSCPVTIDRYGDIGTPAQIQGLKVNTASNCAAAGSGASPSLVACGAAAAGSFSCATNASAATCVISTTAITTNSEVFIQPSAAAGAKLSVTCNTSSDTGLTAPRLASISNGTSFTINLGTFITNPECFNYWLVN